MTEENKKLLEELTQDRIEEVMRLEADNEAGKIAFNELASLLKQQLGSPSSRLLRNEKHSG